MIDFQVRIAFNARTSVKTFDPAKIQMDTEAVILDNLYSPLLRESNEGLMEPFFAEHYHWNGNALHLQLRSNYKTVDGWRITAKDAEFTLKRALVSNTNAHGDLALFLCPGSSVRDVEAPCPGISATENEIVLTVVKASYKPFLLKLLSSMDFGIIPKAACNLKSPALDIIDHRNTTGPYYVSHDDPHGAFTLSANPGHWLRPTGIPEVLQFAPSQPLEALKALKSGTIDFIPSIMVPPSLELEGLRADNDLNFFDTYPIRKLLIGSTHIKLREFSIAERLAIHEQVREALFKQPESAAWSQSLDFYPTLGEGALTHAQMNELKSSIESSRQTKIHRQITLGVLSQRAFDLLSSALKDNSNIKLVRISKMAPFLPASEQPDFYVYSTDSAFRESFSLVSYNVKAESMDLTKEASAAWMNQYMSLENKEERIHMLKELNFRSLSKGIIGILGEAPYTEVSRKPFRYNGSRFFVGSALWKIRHD